MDDISLALNPPRFVKHHKPPREACAYVERELATQPSRFCLITCHTIRPAPSRRRGKPH